ncbi:MAG: hypothetical protein HKP61_20905 [Dactylosporangium sp.]|nr:hypothetical protein [Dactylosporangium sp.]NNJ63343.1 hypothetical protein [Dactylosporangium sp.]
MPIGVNLLLGIPAIIPFFLVWYFMVNGPLGSLGWAQRNPTENDGMLPMVIVVVPVFCLFGLIWWLVNLLLRRMTAVRAVPAFQYWSACVLACLVPYAMGLLLF